MKKYKELREEAFLANMEIPARGLAIYTWGNVSAFDAAAGVFAIKPSGVPYDKLTPDSMVVVDLEGKVGEGTLRPSSDTKTHLVLYREFCCKGGEAASASIAGITHTHSPYAVAWAQAARPVPVFGTTHADHGAESVPCTPFMSEEALKKDYETETGNMIVDTFKKENKDPALMNMVLVAGHGPFTWGTLLTITLKPNVKTLPQHIVRKHWERKHGATSYYGQ
jgi:L-ribulose-5-phosphate 4-epimerase